MITIITTTYYPDSKLGRERADVAGQAIESWFNHLKYDGEFRLHIADDGSGIAFEIGGGYNKMVSRQHRKGVGASLNTGFKSAFTHSPLALYIVDDWILQKDLDLNPWAALLTKNESLGIVRLGPPHPGLTGEVIKYEQGWALSLDKHDYAYAMRPSMYHKRFFDAYGWFSEQINCWECERIFNEHVCATNGPGIVYALPDSWYHKDTLPLGTMEP